ncbi:MAG: hypothetical protein MI757_17590 [Pirellulales bacterium]|nr:hypothetical protein [Pirellulales bacterium]
MHVRLPPDIEAIAQQAAKARGYDNVDDYVAATVRQSAQSDTADSAKASEDATTSDRLPYAQWKVRFEQFLKQRKATNPNVDDSRENMYFDRT